MVLMFNCADVVLNVCMEGFGLSQIQAQACGVPVITLSEGAGPELVTFGWEAPPLAVETSAHQMAQPLPNPVAIAKCLEEAWKMRVESGSPLRSKKSVQFIRDNFGWSKIAEQWFGVIDRCMEDREKYCLDIPPPSDDLDSKAREFMEFD